MEVRDLIRFFGVDMPVERHRRARYQNEFSTQTGAGRFR